MKLQKHITENHGGNVSEFAATKGVRYDQVSRWIKRGCIFLDGEVYCAVKAAKLDKQKGEGE